MTDSAKLRWNATIEHRDRYYKWSVELRQGTRHLTGWGYASSYHGGQTAIRQLMRQFRVPRRIRKQV